MKNLQKIHLQDCKSTFKRQTINVCMQTHGNWSMKATKK